MNEFALMGGIVIGLASALLLLALGRVAGISGIVSGLLVGATDWQWRMAFVCGLVLGGAATMLWFDAPVEQVASLPTVLLAGLLVGFGTVLGSGCTSGHGVCGLARRSKRSFISVLIFMGVGMLTVTLVKWGQL